MITLPNLDGDSDVDMDAEEDYHILVADTDSESEDESLLLQICSLTQSSYMQRPGATLYPKFLVIKLRFIK